MKRLIFTLLCLTVGSIMALHHVDKKNINRNSPQPNTHDITTDVLGKAMAFTSNTTQSAVLRAVDGGTVTIPTPGGVAGSYSVTITHDLSFVPFVVASIDNGSLLMPIPATLIDTSGGANDGKVLENYRWYALSSQVTFIHEVSQAGINSGNYSNSAVPVQYYLLQQTAGQ